MMEFNIEKWKEERNRTDIEISQEWMDFFEKFIRDAHAFAEYIQASYGGGDLQYVIDNLDELLGSHSQRYVDIFKSVLSVYLQARIGEH